MKKYAQINIASGEVMGVINLQSTYNYPELPTNGILYKELDSSIDEATFCDTNIWKNNAWATRDARPGPYHVWNNYEWAFDSDKFWKGIRFKRAKLLEQCDWTQMPDVALDSDTKQTWANYRQALREIPSTYSSATSESDITWPAKPVSQGS